MTPQSLSYIAWVSAPGHIAQLRRSLLLALLCALSALAVMSAPWSSLADRLAELAPPPQTAAAPETASSAAADPLRDAVAAPARKVEALAGYLSRKYRVSEDVVQDLVTTAFVEGARIGLDPVLIVAVMAVESSFNPIAESVAGARGLMQIIPRFHPEKFPGGEKTTFDPQANIRAGALALKEYIRRGGGISAGLQIYNGSAPEGSNYSSRVLSEQQRLQQIARRGAR